ncbi:MAG TPA: hypothetical protein P5137_05740 [Candidatus Brocadiia bacterium]|nr:hypothetical protein [Candidatus Brocadiia bacterium]
MTENADVRVTCPSCGKTLRFPPSAPAGKEYRCPKCNAHVTIPGAAPPKAPDAFLHVCPVCAKGKVIKNPGGHDDETYTCVNCASTLAETIFGFLYVNLNPQYAADPAKIKAQTFTKPQLQAMSAQAAETGASAINGSAAVPPAAKPARKPTAHEKPKAAPEPAAQLEAKPAAPAPPAEPAPPAPEAPVQRTAAPTPPAEPAPAAAPPAEPSDLALIGSELVGEASGAGNGAAQAEELWWEVDEEELQKRKAAAAKPGA